MSVRYRPTDRVAARRVEEELLLLDLEKGEYLVSRGVGPLVWDLLGDGRNVDEVVEAVSARFGEDPALVRRDVEEFVASLEAMSFVVREEA